MGYDTMLLSHVHKRQEELAASDFRVSLIRKLDCPEKGGSKFLNIFFSCGAAAQRGPWPAHLRGF